MAVGLFAVAGMALLATTVARAGDQDFKLVNKTGVEIHALHVAPHSSNEWGEDILGRTRWTTERAWKSRSESMIGRTTFFPPVAITFRCWHCRTRKS